jgi:hypothetical protein
VFATRSMQSGTPSGGRQPTPFERLTV